MSARDELRDTLLGDFDPADFVVTYYKAPEAYWRAMHHHRRIRTIAAFMIGMTLGAALGAWLG